MSMRGFQEKLNQNPAVGICSSCLSSIGLQGSDISAFKVDLMLSQLPVGLSWSLMVSWVLLWRGAPWVT